MPAAEIWLPIGMSVVSLILAAFALGWNVYRDVILKARVRVRFDVITIYSHEDGHAKEERSKLRILVTNHGPGPIQIDGIHGMVAPWWRRLIRRPKHFAVLNDPAEPLNATLPAKLDVGDSIGFYLPHEERSFLSTDATDIGVVDSFGRLHVAPKRHVRKGRAEFQAEFPRAKTRTI